MRGIKIPQQDFALKRQGGLMREGGGAYLRDTTVYIFFYRVARCQASMAQVIVLVFES